MSSVKPYKGNEPYLFISYSHKDRDVILPVIHGLTKRHFRVWYDEGIDPGTEWPEYIARQLSGSACCIAFLSDSALHSQNCRREINYAIQTSVPLLAVFIEEVTLSPGMALQLSPVQALFSYKYTPGDFIDALAQVPLLAPCQAQTKPEISSGAGYAPDKPASGNPDTYEPDSGKPGPNKPDSETPRSCKPDSDKPDASRPGPYEPDSGDPASGDPAPRRRRALLASLLAAAATAVGIGSFLFLRSRNSAKPQEDLLRVQLTAPEDMSVRGFNNSLEILENRVRILTEDTYTLDVAVDTVSLSFPKRYCMDGSPEDILKCYITRPQQLNAYNRSTHSWIPIESGQLESVELLSGSVEDADAAALGIEQEEYPYFRLKLSESWMQEHPKAALWGEDFAFALDAEQFYPFIYTLDTFPSDDPSVYYVIDTDNGENFQKLLEYNLTHDILDGAFNFHIVEDVDWEDPKESAHPGENQVAQSALTGTTAWVTYTASSASLSEGERIDAETVLKKRLDSLGTPYAFGLTHSETGDGEFSVEISTKHLDSTILCMLGSSIPQVTISCSDRELQLYSKDIASLAQDGSKAVLTVADSARRKLAALLESAPQDGRESLLRIDRFPILKGDPSSWSAPDAVFDSCCYDGFQTLDDSSGWVLQMANVLSCGGELPCNFTPSIEALTDKNSGKSPDDLPYLYASLFEKTGAAIARAFPQTEVSFSQNTYLGGLMAYVTLHFTDMDHIDRAADQILEIKDLMDFEDSWFAHLWFTVADLKVSGQKASVSYIMSPLYDSSTNGIMTMQPDVSVLAPEGTLSGHEEELRLLLEPGSEGETEAQSKTTILSGVQKND